MIVAVPDPRPSTYGHRNRLTALTLALSVTAGTAASLRAEGLGDIPTSFASRDHEQIMTVHAVGAQVFECKAGASGGRAWSFREPIATLVQDGKTIGRHSAGPRWDLADAGVTGKMTATAPSASPDAIPQLELRVVDRRGTGPLDQAQWVLRLHTVGGTLSGACEPNGALQGVPYQADYLFLK